MTISRMQQPRQLYGLGSLVKSVTKGIKGAVKGVKNFVKSDFGKIAGLAALGYGLGGAKFLGGDGIFKAGQGLSRFSNLANIPSALGNLPGLDKFKVADKSKGPSFGQTLGMFGLGTAAFTALAAAGLDTDNPNEMPRDVESLRGYLKSGYMKLNPDASPEEAEQFAIQNTSEYATGGRVGLAEGTKMASADNPFFRSDYADEHSYRMFGKPYKDLTASELEEFKEEMERLRNKFMADGGRVNYAKGTEEEGIQSIIIPKRKSDAFMTEEELEATSPGLARSEVGDPMPGRLESAKRLRGVMQLYDRLKNMAESGEMSNKEEAMALFNQRMREESEKLHFLDKEKLEDYIRENRSYGGRMQYAMGSPEENAVQAAGIMDLPLNQNKAGVTELDLRETGGFIPPVGVKEKADDIPAMLSNNEFVFTADAVRGMGNGDVNVGAQRMYEMMKKLENGGRVA